MPGALVEARGAGRVLAVDAERGRRLAALGEAAEALVQQRQTEPAAAPRGPDAEHPIEPQSPNRFRS